MDAGLPDRETIRTALALATRAPSVHNSQPWRWQVDKHHLHLYANLDLHLCSTDPDSRDLLVSCGLSLHHCVVALAALGWRATIHRLPDPKRPEHLASVETHPHPVGDIDVTLAAAIPRRRTDRRRYSAWSVPTSAVALMTARAARWSVLVRQIDSLPELRRTIAEAAWQHAMDSDYLTELSTWSGRYASLAGVPAHNTPKPDPTAPIPARAFAGPVLSQPVGTVPGDDSAVVLALGTEEDTVLARLRAGEATSAVLLTATALGLASCPITEPLELAATRDAVQVQVFGTEAFPQMLLRIGWAPVNADPLPATPRRPLSDLVDFLHDAKG